MGKKASNSSNSIDNYAGDSKEMTTALSEMAGHRRKQQAKAFKYNENRTGGKMMKIKRIIDKYNHSKIWVIKLYKGGAVYVNQEIKGYKVSKKFTRMTMKGLRNIGVIA